MERKITVQNELRMKEDVSTQEKLHNKRLYPKRVRTIPFSSLECGWVANQYVVSSHKVRPDCVKKSSTNKPTLLVTQERYDTNTPPTRRGGYDRFNAPNDFLRFLYIGLSLLLAVLDFNVNDRRRNTFRFLRQSQRHKLIVVKLAIAESDDLACTPKMLIQDDLRQRKGRYEKRYQRRCTPCPDANSLTYATSGERLSAKIEEALTRKQGRFKGTCWQSSAKTFNLVFRHERLRRTDLLAVPDN